MFRKLRYDYVGEFQILRELQYFQDYFFQIQVYF